VTQSEDGLPGNTVVGVAQTPDGFLWVATASGLVRFDGVRFQETVLSGNPTQAFLADRRGRLWLGKITASGRGEAVWLEAGTTRVFPAPVWGAMTEDGEGAVVDGQVVAAYGSSQEPAAPEIAVPPKAENQPANYKAPRVWGQ
jgi:hypothetical protein